MNMMIDTHAHLSGLARRGIDTHQTLKDIFAEGFAGIIDISLEPGDLSERIKEFSGYSKVCFSSGLWPWPASIANRKTLIPELEKDLLFYLGSNTAAPEGTPKPLICALGEFGLDHNWNGEGKEGTSDLPGERELMEMQMDMAQRLNLPVIIHSRDAAKETAEIVKSYPNACGVIHCFSYSPEEAKAFLDMGYYISFAGNITYKNANAIQEACRFVPNDRLILETDCPYLAPVPHRGKPAHPGMVEEVYKKAAELRCMDIETMSEQISENVKQLFGF